MTVDITDITELQYLIDKPTSIKLEADRISVLLKDLRDINKVFFVNKIREKVQKEAEEAFIKAGGFGAILMATGTGKSKITVNLTQRMVNKKPDANTLISVPTIKLRDNGWQDEFIKWGKQDLWENNVQRCCYASIMKYKDQTFDFVTFDEGHNITERATETFFKQNNVRSCLILTATKPTDKSKIRAFKSQYIKPVYELSLDESVKLGLVAPYDITIIKMKLDNVDKYLPAGNKNNRFFQTEKEKYQYLSKLTIAYPSKFSFIQRKTFIYGLRSKTKIAKAILENVIPKHLRTLIFCGSIEQAIELHDRRYFSKPTLSKADYKKPEKVERFQRIIENYEGDKGFNDFVEGNINQLACVDALNEGHNLPYLDCAYLVQISKQELDLIQRMGRALRFRPGHRGKIIILCVADTVDQEWVEKATSSLSTANIKWIEVDQLRTGQDKIIFD